MNLYKLDLLADAWVQDRLAQTGSNRPLSVVKRSDRSVRSKASRLQQWLSLLRKVKIPEHMGCQWEGLRNFNP